jgi:hypothetical protein
MFMFLGYSPELTQVVYRIGDSTTNIISPMMSFFALIIAFIQKYDRKAGIGTVIATMLPYSMAFLLGWMVLLVVWLLLGVPLGPGAGAGTAAARWMPAKERSSPVSTRMPLFTKTPTVKCPRPKMSIRIPTRG